ncbi:MAG TPA: hypothetical protein VE669_10410 [Actinomycetota bacterium]|nr:hypothetical protein [Actinomycetota bacterium]
MPTGGRSDPSAEPNRYTVDVRRGDAGWSVAIVDPDGREASVRACGDEVEAWTYASTVRQHIEWLSEEKFREYYRLPEG